MIVVERIGKRFGAVHAVRDLSFDVRAGETFAIIGPNGAGKTTTLKMLLGLVRPDVGRIRIGPDGLSPHAPRARHHLGYVPQRVEFTPGRTVAEVLGFFAELRGLPPESVPAALARVGLAGYAARRATELSGGYAQRLSLGQALLGDPSLLVLDEPTASLDPQATWEFRTLVEQLRRQGKTVLLCSHLLSEVERVADRVLIMVEGRAAALEELGALRSRQANATRWIIGVADGVARARDQLARCGIAGDARDEDTLVVEAADGRGPRAIEALRRAGIEVRGFEMQRPTLEEIFLDVVGGTR